MEGGTPDERKIAEKKLKAMPELWPELGPLREAFYQLRRTANGPWGVGPITFGEISAYFEARGMWDPEVRQCWTRLLQAVDAKYLAWIKEQKEQEASYEKNEH